MSRFLFVVPPWTGHVNPTVSVARELELRGHEVAWTGHATAVRALLPAGARLLELEEQVMQRAAFDDKIEQSRRRRGLAAFKFLWEEVFIPLARFMHAGVDQAVDRFGPSVLVVDQQALAGAVVARRRGLAWASFCTTSASVTETLGDLPTVRRWRDDLLTRLFEDCAVEAGDPPDLSPHRVIVFSTEALVGPLKDFPRHYAFVGPSIEHRPNPVAFPWQDLRDLPRVLISVGTVNERVAGRFYHTVVEALRNEPLQAILVAPPELAPPAPENMIVRPYVPQLELLRRVQGVVCHAGHNTVCEALANGLPLVVAPIKDDQPVVARQVADAGAGIRLKFGRVRPERLREAVRRILGEPAFRESAARIRASFRDAGGAPRAADHLEGLAGAAVGAAPGRIYIRGSEDGPPGREEPRA